MNQTQNEIQKTFKHLQAAHCESGVAASLSNYGGSSLSEPMAFGIGSGLFFAHMPFVKIMDLPLTTFRSFPGTILKKVFRRTGMHLNKQQFRSEEKALTTLDKLLDQGIPAGVQLSVFWLPYLPEQFRFQFNAHHAIVCGKKDADYIISDPMGEETVTCPVKDFRRAWFAKGPLAPKGALYSSPGGIQSQRKDLTQAIQAGLTETCNRMLRVPLPYFGVKGIRKLAKLITKWPKTLGDARKVKLNLGQVVRMQEEVGTGGAGFRFLYAAFLQEASQNPRFSFLSNASDLMTESGDRFRQFSLASAKLCKAGTFAQGDLKTLSDILYSCSDSEEKAFRLIDKGLK